MEKPKFQYGGNTNISNSIIGSGNIINGSNVSGGNVIGSNTKNGSLKDVDYLKEISAVDLSRLTIRSSSVNININNAKGEIIKAHLYGKINTDSNVIFQFDVSGSELTVESRVETLHNVLNSSLRLDIDIPIRYYSELNIENDKGDIVIKSFSNANQLSITSKVGDISLKNLESNILNIKSEKGDISLSKKVQVNSIDIISGTGDVESNASTEEFKCISSTGNISVYSKLHKNIDIDISKGVGDLDIVLKNVKHWNLDYKAEIGNISDMHRNSTEGHDANIHIESKVGNIMIA